LLQGSHHRIVPRWNFRTPPGFSNKTLRGIIGSRKLFAARMSRKTPSIR